MISAESDICQKHFPWFPPEFSVNYVRCDIACGKRFCHPSVRVCFPDRAHQVEFIHQTADLLDIHDDFLCRSLLQGDSATGKTELVRLIRDWEENGNCAVNGSFYRCLWPGQGGTGSTAHDRRNGDHRRIKGEGARQYAGEYQPLF